MSRPRTEGDGLFTRILLATDGSGNARRAAGLAIELARRHGSKLIVAHAIPQPLMPGSAPLASGGVAFGPFLEEYYKRSRQEARKLIREVVDLAQEQDVDVRGEILDAPESVVQQLVDAAKNEKVDLVVVGTRGLTGFRRLLLGSVSGGLVSHAHCAVLIVR